MDKDCATIVVATANKAASDLGDLVHLLDDATDKPMKLAIAKAVYEIMEYVMSPVLEAHPTLKEDIERRLAKYDRVF